MQPDSVRRDFYHGKEVCGELFVSGGDAVELFELVEGAFDPVSPSIQGFGEGVPGLQAFAVRDYRDGIMLFDQVKDPFGVIGLVGDEETVGRQGRQHGTGGHGVVRLAGAEVIADRQAGNVRYGVEFRGQPGNDPCNDPALFSAAQHPTVPTALPEACSAATARSHTIRSLADRSGPSSLSSQSLKHIFDQVSAPLCQDVQLRRIEIVPQGDHWPHTYPPIAGSPLSQKPPWESPQ